MEFRLIWILAIVVAACRPDPELLEPELIDVIDLGDLYGTRTGAAVLGEDYRDQVYYSLENNEVVATVNKFTWDFGMTPDSVLRLNSAVLNLRIAEAPGPWDAPVDAAELTWLYDGPTGDSATLAVGANWADRVWVVDRGLDSEGTPRGLFKCQIHSTPDSLFLHVAQLDGSEAQVFGGTLDAHLHLTAWSLEAGQVDAAPPADSWDLLFTSYLYVFDPETEPFPYAVTGALLNPTGHKAALLTDQPFADVEASDAVGLTDDEDAVGYDWKVYDLDLGLFTVRDNWTYIIQPDPEILYALAFTGFNDALGRRGTPQFSFRRLPL